MKNINEEKLQELGIFELRNIARDVGVYSPTLFKKQELIDKIMRVITGKDEPYIKKTKQGRPPKNISTLNDFVDVIMPSKIFEEKKNTNYSYFNDINESINVEDYNSGEIVFKGLVKVYNKEYSLVFYQDYKEDKNVIFVNTQQTKFYSLKSGDFITGKAVFIDDSKPYILKEIFSINNVQFTKGFERAENFENKIAIFATSRLKTNIYKQDDKVFSDVDLLTPLAKGQRILLKGSNNFSFNILHKLTTGSNNLLGVAVLVDESPENYFDTFSNKNLEVISNNYGNKNNDFLLEFEVKTANLLRRVELGENVILFVNDLDKFFCYLKNNYIMQKMNIDEAIVKAKRNLSDLILLGKNTQNGSLTILTSTNLTNNEFDSLFNNLIVLDEKKYEVLLNEDLSRTQNIDKLLTKSELEKLRNRLINQKS